jgi:glutamate synthase (NADPH/NADH) small chain
MACDLVVIAIGAGANPLLANATPGLELNKWGYIVARDENGATSKPAVWAGGDIVTGSATVILAMGAGRKAANAIHQYLMNKESILSSQYIILRLQGILVLRR